LPSVQHKELTVKWSQQYATGVTELDEQHKMLFKMSEDFREALDAGYGARSFDAMLASLDRYALGHFGREDQCMHRYQCPVAATNSEAHGQFTRALAGFSQRFAQDGFSRSEAHDLVDFIDRWLSTHILGIDSQLKRCVDSQGLL